VEESGPDMKITRALLSVSDKTGLIDFARGLAALGVEILSTGGTATALREAGLAVVDVSTFTGHPEILDGRVKTLHPKVHGGILQRRANPADQETCQKLGLLPIDLVCVNLYPFEQSPSIENIDIGGPSMLRSAAKNHADVIVLTDPADYSPVLAALQTAGDLPLEHRRALAQKVFARTSAYDAAITAWLAGAPAVSASHNLPPALQPDPLQPDFLGAPSAPIPLRYGENPHQSATFRPDSPLPAEATLAAARILHGKEMSYNNYVDGDAALEAVRELHAFPAAVIIKHTNPCGAATGATLAEALAAAWEGDVVSSFGSVIALTRPVDLATAQVLKGRFVEALIAPAFESDALEFLKAKSKDIRLISLDRPLAAPLPRRLTRQINGGTLAQDADLNAPEGWTPQIQKEFGEGAIMRLGNEGAVSKIASISTGALTLDMALGIGGVPRGRVVEIFGPESSGKTTLVLHIIANAQKPAACRLHRRRARPRPRLRQEDRRRPRRPARLPARLRRRGPASSPTSSSAPTRSMSSSSTPSPPSPPAPSSKARSATHVGLQARLMSQAMRKLTGRHRQIQDLCIFTNQIREKIGVMFGNPETTPGGRALKFYASVRLDIRRIAAIKDRRPARSSATAPASRSSRTRSPRPSPKAEFDILYAEGAKAVIRNSASYACADKPSCSIPIWLPYMELPPSASISRSSEMHIVSRRIFAFQLTEEWRIFKVAKCNLKAWSASQVPTVCLHRTWRHHGGHRAQQSASRPHERRRGPRFRETSPDGPLGGGSRPQGRRLGTEIRRQFPRCIPSHPPTDDPA
jgi:phosphoribosylaminoimidazolecarboxamide formyltransferase / IMP cyclohydrolase